MSDPIIQRHVPEVRLQGRSKKEIWHGKNENSEDVALKIGIDY